MAPLRNFFATIGIASFVALSVIPSVVYAVGIDSSNTTAEFDQSSFGTVNFDVSGNTDPIDVTTSAITGTAWGNVVGWINFGPLDGGGGVTVSCSGTTGTVSGAAWGEQSGWLNFGSFTNATGATQVTINSDGQWNGEVWSEHAGWLSFSCPGSACVQTTAAVCQNQNSGGSSVSGSLPSSWQSVDDDEQSLSTQQLFRFSFPQLIPELEFEESIEIIPLPDDTPTSDVEIRPESPLEPVVEEPVREPLTPEALSTVDTVGLAIIDIVTSAGDFFVAVGKTITSTIRVTALALDEFLIAVGRGLFAVGTAVVSFFDAAGTFVATLTTQTIVALTNQQEPVTSALGDAYRQATTRSGTTITQVLYQTRETIRGSGEYAMTVLEQSPEDDPRIPEHLRDHRYKEVQIRIALADGAPLKGAHLTLLSEPKEAVTDDRGQASFTDVEVGEHTLTIAFGKFRGEQQLFFADDVPRLLVNVTPSFNEGVDMLAFVVTLLVAIVGAGIVIWQIAKRHFANRLVV